MSPSGSAVTQPKDPSQLCDEGRAKFVEGLASCASTREAKEELKLFLLEIMDTVHKTSMEDTLLRLYDEINEATDTGRKLKRALAEAAAQDARAAQEPLLLTKKKRSR